MSSEDFIEIMDELGRRIEGPAQKVYDLAMRQVYVELVIALILFVIGVVLALKIIKPSLKRRHELQAEQAKAGRYSSSYEYSFIEREPVLFVSSLAVSALLLFASINLLVAVSGALNPGWKALRLILGSIT